MKKEFVTVKKDELIETVKSIVDKPHRLAAISGVDNGETVEVLYHFDLIEKFVTLRVVLDKENKTVSSITPLVPAATLYEREVSEMFGVNMEGHPSPGRLFTPDKYSGEPPLLKKSSGV